MLKVTAIFKCVVRVVAATPYQAELLCSPTTGRYNMRLTLEDSTARIHAYVSDEDGVRTKFDLTDFRILLAPITPMHVNDVTLYYSVAVVDFELYSSQLSVLVLQKKNIFMYLFILFAFCLAVFFSLLVMIIYDRRPFLMVIPDLKR